MKESRNENPDSGMVDVIYISLPKLTNKEMEVFSGAMHKALLTGINVTKKTVTETLSKSGIRVEFK
ncbi:hypothetical protein ACVQ8M_09320 [Edwardsiella tarda]